MMIGRLHFPYRQRTAEAVLLDDGRWECPEVPALVRVLDTLYSPARDRSKRPNHHLQLAARWLKGTVEAKDEDARRN